VRGRRRRVCSAHHRTIDALVRGRLARPLTPRPLSPKGRGGIVALLSLIAGLLLPVPASAETQAKPQRIVSLNVCVDQLLLLLVDRGRIAALTQFATDRDFSNLAVEARGLRQNHGRAEEILPLAPDLVIGGEFTTTETIALLRRIGLRVEVLKLANSLADVRANMLWLGRLVGEADKAEALVRDFDRRLAAVAAAVPPGPRPVLAFYNTSGYTAAPGTLADDAIRAAGFDNLAAKLELGGGGRLHLEWLATQRVDALLVLDTVGTPTSRAVETVGHPAIARFAEGRPLAAMPGRLWVCETPFVAEAVERLAQLRAAAERRRQ
jgi:iron complex transport system substrate-binding protein